MRFLVTRGHGVIGHFLVRALLSRGDDVTVLDVRPDLIEAESGSRFILGSIAEPNLVRAAVEGCGGIFHLAAVTAVDASENNLEKYARRTTTYAWDAEPAYGSF